MKNVIVSMVAVAGIASGAMAQADGRLNFQVWNGSAWTSSVTANPGDTVQIRAVVSYAGSNTSVFALGGITYQPTFSNADNDGTGAQADQLGAWRNNGSQGNAIANSMLSAAEGDSGAALPSYGRVVFGGTAMNTSSQNAITTFRHAGGTSGAPAGTNWLRVAGSSVTTFPAASLPTAGDATATALNNINRSVLSNQQAQTNPVTGIVNTSHVAGTQNLVIFRAAITLSDLTQLTDRVININSAAGSLQRVGAVNSADDTRYMTWQINNFGTTIQTGVVISGASITVPAIPSPATAALLGMGGLVAARRRRA